MFKPTNLKTAKKYFQRWTGHHLTQTLDKSGQRVAYVFQRPEPPFEQYCVTFKREWYTNFSHHFPHVPDKGWGQITSLNLLRFCEKEGIAWLVAVMPSGAAYKIEVLQFLKYFDKYGTEVPHLPGEVAAHIRMWERMFPL